MTYSLRTTQDAREILGRERIAEIARFHRRIHIPEAPVLVLHYRPKPYRLEKAAWFSWGFLAGGAWAGFIWWLS